MATVPYRFHNQSGYVPASELDSDFDFLSSGGGIGGLVIGSSPITGGTTTRILYDNAGVLGEHVITGTGNVVMSDGPTLSGSLAATGSNFLNEINTTVTTGDGTGDIGGTSNLYTATGSDSFVQFRNIAIQTFINTTAGTGAIALCTDEFVSLGPTGGQDTGNLTSLVVHRAHYSNKSTSVIPQEITTAYTFWAAGVDINDVGATGTVKTNAALNITDQGDTSRSAYSTGKLTRDTHGVRINDFTDGAISSFGLTSLLTASVPATSSSVTGSDAPSTTITIGGTITGIFFPHQTIMGGAISGVTIVSQTSAAATATSSIASINRKVLTVGGVVTGTWAANQLVMGAGVAANTVIFAQLTGSAGGAGTYSLSQSSIVGPIAMTGGQAGGAGAYVLSNSVTVSSTVPISITASTFKQNLNLTGTAPNIITGATRIGDTSLPQTEALDVHYAPGTLPAGQVTASQFITNYTDADSGGTSQPFNLLSRILSAGTHNLAQVTVTQHELDLNNTGGTITAAYGSLGQILGASLSGTTVTTARVTASIFQGGGTGTYTNLYLLSANDVNFGGATDTIGTLAGVFVGNVGHGNVTNAYGLLLSDITAAGTKTAGIFSAVSSGTGKYFIRAEGTADSTFRGNARFGGSTSPVATVDVTGTLTTTGLITTPASSSGGSGLRLPHGAAPSSPVNGDLWTTNAGLFVRINGSTVGPLT